MMTLLYCLFSFSLGVSVTLFVKNWLTNFAAEKLERAVSHLRRAHELKSSGDREDFFSPWLRPSDLLDRIMSEIKNTKFELLDVIRQFNSEYPDVLNQAVETEYLARELVLKIIHEAVVVSRQRYIRCHIEGINKITNPIYLQHAVEKQLPCLRKWVEDIGFDHTQLTLNGKPLSVQVLNEWKNWTNGKIVDYMVDSMERDSPISKADVGQLMVDIEKAGGLENSSVSQVRFNILMSRYQSEQSFNSTAVH